MYKLYSFAEFVKLSKIISKLRMASTMAPKSINSIMPTVNKAIMSKISKK